MKIINCNANDDDDDGPAMIYVIVIKGEGGDLNLSTEPPPRQFANNKLNVLHSQTATRMDFTLLIDFCAIVEMKLKLFFIC